MEFAPVFPKPGHFCYPGLVLVSNANQLIRLAVAFVLGGIIGTEREITQKPAGLRTHIVISMASALFTLLSLSPAFGAGTDPTRIAAQILTGMGFVGAGVIISTGGHVRGVTTATSLWITAAIGMASGLGEFELAIVAAFLTLVALWIFRYLEKPLSGKSQIK
jgi:putative Mg2+ transporter-C (MgtC) family protein